MKIEWLENRLRTRPRIRNILHSVGVTEPTTQTNRRELSLLGQSARDARMSVEIGSYEGVSAAIIAESMHPDGILYCIDPWPAAPGKSNPCYEIFRRGLRRRRLWGRVRILRGTSADMNDDIPSDVDFIFVDGNHSWTGVEQDWSIVRSKLRVGGVVCLHDALIPVGATGRLDSAEFYDQIIAADRRFTLEAQVDSLVVLKKIRN